MRYISATLLVLLSYINGFSQEYKITLLGDKHLAAGDIAKYRITVDDKPAYDYLLMVTPLGKSIGDVKINNNGKPICIVNFGFAEAYKISIVVNNKTVTSLTQPLFYLPNPRLILAKDTLSKKQFITSLKNVLIADPYDYREIPYEFVKLKVSVVNNGTVIEVSSSNPGEEKMILDLINSAKIGSKIFLSGIKAKVKGSEKIFPIQSEVVFIDS